MTKLSELKPGDEFSLRYAVLGADEGSHYVRVLTLSPCKAQVMMIDKTLPVFDVKRKTVEISVGTEVPYLRDSVSLPSEVPWTVRYIEGDTAILSRPAYGGQLASMTMTLDKIRGRLTS